MLGLALEGGGAKGAYEIGAYRALTEMGYRFDVICGVSIGAINAALLAQGKRIFLPKCGEGSSMQFYRITGLDDGSVFPGAYDIPEPTGQEMPVLTECSLCIVPGVAFTAEGSRLGQGGGYYDRWLRAHPDLRTLAMTYAHLIQERIPCEAHDCRVDAVITEQYQGG